MHVAFIRITIIVALLIKDMAFAQKVKSYVCNILGLLSPEVADFPQYQDLVQFQV